MVTINGNEIDIPIPLPTGRENLDQLVANGTMYARASRMAQTIGGPFTYRFEGDFVVVVKKFETREEAEASLTKAIESLETLRYFL